MSSYVCRQPLSLSCCVCALAADCVLQNKCEAGRCAAVADHVSCTVNDGKPQDHTARSAHFLPLCPSHYPPISPNLPHPLSPSHHLPTSQVVTPLEQTLPVASSACCQPCAAVYVSSIHLPKYIAKRPLQALVPSGNPGPLWKPWSPLGTLAPSGNPSPVWNFWPSCPYRPSLYQRPATRY